MTTEMAKQYSLEDFQSFLFLGKFHELPESVIDTLSKLELSLIITDQQGQTHMNTTPYRSNYLNMKKKRDSGIAPSGGDKPYYGKFDTTHGNNAGNKRSGGDNNGSNNKREITGEDWAAMRSFKSTKIETKTGADKAITDIRVALNKLSVANYAKLEENILKQIHDYFQNEEFQTAENTEKLVKTVFDIASNNMVLCDPYARLYRSLLEEHPIFAGYLEKSIDEYTATVYNLKYVDADDDYDGFCAYKKKCENCKSVAKFLAMCYRLGTLTEKHMVDLIRGFIVFVNENMDKDGHMKEIEELAENIFILVSQCCEGVPRTEWMEDIIDTIIELSNRKAKDHKSLSNRAVFKFRDLVDCL